MQSCEFRQVGFKQVPTRPAVGLAKAKDSNKIASIYIHEIHISILYFHMINIFSRYKNAVTISNMSLTLKSFINLEL